MQNESLTKKIERKSAIKPKNNFYNKNTKFDILTYTKYTLFIIFVRSQIELLGEKRLHS